MAEIRQGQIGTFTQSSRTSLSPTQFALASATLGAAPALGIGAGTYKSSSSSGKVYGSLIDFNTIYKGQNVTGTYNPTQGGGKNQNLTQDQNFVTSAFNLLNAPGSISLGEAQKAVSGNASDNPFFGEFFNYYLGIAQERQANLQKSVGRKDLLSGSSASDMLGGSLI